MHAGLEVNAGLVTFALCAHSAHKGELGISSFGVSVTTMEDVFIKVGKGLEDTIGAR